MELFKGMLVWCLWMWFSGSGGSTVHLVNLEVFSNLNNYMVLCFMENGLKYLERRFELSVPKQRSGCEDTF